MTHRRYLPHAHPTVVAAAVAALFVGSTAVQAQEVQSVTVTATKRSEPIQQVPMSVKALTGEQLQERGVTSLEEALPGEPSVIFTRGRTAVDRQISIRGISDVGGLSLTQGTVAVYIDELPTSVVQQSGNPDIALYDIDKVILIRGPRSTLYGSASLGGTIKIETRNPSLREREGSVRLGLSKTAGAGDWNHELVASLSTPVLKDQLALGITAYRNKQAGYIDSPTLGKDVNGIVIDGVRVALYAEPTKQLSIAGRLYHQEIKGQHGSMFSPATGEALPTDTKDSFGDKLQAGSLSIKYKFDGFELVSATSYFDKRAPYKLDNEAFFLPFGVDPAGTYVSYGTFDSRVFAQEFRLMSDEVKQGLTWSAGVFYSTEATKNQSTTPVPFIGDLFGSDSTTDRKQTAIFGELGYKFAGGWAVNAGLRRTKYTSEDNNQIVIFGSPSGQAGTNTETPTTPHASISYTTGRDTYYAQASKGFRFGKLNFPIFSPGFPIPVFASSDSLWTYELGAKTSWLANKVNLNVAVFQTKWDNPQLTLLTPSGLAYVDALGRLNPGAGVDSRGFELELVARPTSALELSAGLGYVDSTFNRTVTGLDPTGAATPGGTRLVGIPKVTANVNAKYHFGVAGAPAWVGGSVQHVDTYNSSYSTAPGVNRQLGGYTAVDLRAGLDFDAWSLTAFISNATNERPYVLQQFFGAEAVGSIKPRTVGMNAVYRF